MMNAEARARQEGGDHYASMAVQPWDAMRAWLSREQFTGFLLGNAIKYLARFNATAPGNGGMPDLKKAMRYLEAAIEFEAEE